MWRRLYDSYSFAIPQLYHFSKCNSAEKMLRAFPLPLSDAALFCRHVFKKVEWLELLFLADKKRDLGAANYATSDGQPMPTVVWVIQVWVKLSLHKILCTMQEAYVLLIGWLKTIKKRKDRKIIINNTAQTNKLFCVTCIKPELPLSNTLQGRTSKKVRL